MEESDDNHNLSDHDLIDAITGVYLRRQLSPDYGPSNPYLEVIVVKPAIGNRYALASKIWFPVEENCLDKNILDKNKNPLIGDGYNTNPISIDEGIGFIARPFVSGPSSCLVCILRDRATYFPNLVRVSYMHDGSGDTGRSAAFIVEGGNMTDSLLYDHIIHSINRDSTFILDSNDQKLYLNRNFLLYINSFCKNIYDGGEK